MSWFELSLYAALILALLFLVFLVVIAIIEGSMSRKADARLKAGRTQGWK